MLTARSCANVDSQLMQHQIMPHSFLYITQTAIAFNSTSKGMELQMEFGEARVGNVDLHSGDANVTLDLRTPVCAR